MRPLPNATEALQDLQHELPRLLAIVNAAFSTWLTREQITAEANLPTGSSLAVRATDMHGYMVHFAKEHYNGLDDKPEAKTYNKIFGVVLADRYFVRFKKFDEALDVTNHSSGQNEKYRKQIPCEELGNDKILLYVGYRPDSTFTQLEGIHLVCRLDDMILWSQELNTLVTEEALTIPFSEAAPVRRVKVRKTGTEGEQATGTDDVLPPTSGQ
jgi:hypothetical protein